MEAGIENFLAKSDDEQLRPTTSLCEIESQIPADDDEVTAIKVSAIGRKMSHYESECKRYGVIKMNVVQRIIRQETKTDKLNLEYSGIGTLQCQIMFDTFQILPATPLTAISLNGNHLEHFCMHAIASFIQTSTTLKELTLEGCKFGDAGSRILSEGISISTSIWHLNLANCSISDDGGEAIAKSFLINDVCNELNLSDNSMGLKTSKAFEEVLSGNKSLKKLDLSHNMLGENKAFVNFVKGLAMNETLEELNLSWNALGGELFGKLLLKSIKSSKLRILKMEHNRLSTSELKKLAIGLKRSETIEEVYIADNFILGGDDVDLINVFKSKSSLKLLSFGMWFHLSHEAFKVLQSIRPHKPFISVIFQNVIMPNAPQEVNMLDIYADRVKYLATSPKKKMMRKDFGLNKRIHLAHDRLLIFKYLFSLFMTQLRNLEDAYLSKSDFLKMLKNFKAKTDEDLIEQYIDACTSNVNEQKKLNVHSMAKHYLNRHPYAQV